MTIAIGQREAAWIWLDKTTGRLANWGILIAERKERQVAEAIAAQAGLALEESDHGWYLLGATAADFVLDERTWQRAAQVAGGRMGTRLTRRVSWHNDRLAQTLLGGAPSKPRAAELTSVPTVSVPTRWEFERRYVEVTSRRRLHQAAPQEAARHRG